MGRKEEVNRRANPRFVTKGETFAYVRNHFSMVGRVRDAGLGGLAIEYTSGRDKGGDGNVEVDILVNRNGFSLLRIPARVVWKEDVLGNKELQYGATKRLGIEFKTLTAGQKSKLEHFLKHHTEAGQ